MKWVATRLICPLFSKQPIMKPDIAIQDLLFGVDQVPVEALINTNAHTRRISQPAAVLGDSIFPLVQLATNPATPLRAGPPEGSRRRCNPVRIP
jgi:hypothetical protein